MKAIGRLRKAICAAAAFALPTRLSRHVLNLFGHRVQSGCSIGFSWIWCDFLGMQNGSRIGHGNLLCVGRALLRRAAYFGRANIIKGPIDVVLRPRAGVGNHNVVVRAKAGISSGRAQLWLGEVAKITSNHRVDCMRSFRLGRFSTLAGAGSQVWTHGYVHDELGEGRYRIDGKVIVEENVYIGSACFISMGIRISKGVIVGGGTTVSKSLTAPGLYVSAPMRALPRPVPPESRDDLRRSSDSLLCETVFVKDTDHRLA